MVDTPVPDDEMSFLYSITGSMAKICAQALREINLADSDKGIAGLIIKYATEIDNGNLATLAKLGPALLQAMESLQMSPRARAVQVKRSNSDDQPTKPKSALDELRNKRLERQNGTTTIHSATS